MFGLRWVHNYLEFRNQRNPWLLGSESSFRLTEGVIQNTPFVKHAYQKDKRRTWERMGKANWTTCCGHKRSSLFWPIASSPTFFRSFPKARSELGRQALWPTCLGTANSFGVEHYVLTKVHISCFVHCFPDRVATIRVSCSILVCSELLQLFTN